MIFRIIISLFISAVLVITSGCKREINSLEPAKNPTFGEVYINSFASGLDYSAFANSKFDAFDIDEREYFKGTSSIKITVPGANDPSGWFAGGAFFSSFPRDLSGYNALTFWGKADRTAIAEVGFGNDNAGNEKYAVMQQNVVFGTSWKKYIIPIPLADKLTAERGMLQYAVGPDANGYGSNIWMDEVQYESIGTIAYPRPVIASKNIEGEVGQIINSGVTGVTFNVDGTDQTLNAAPAYFTLISSDEAIAKPNEDGKISALSVGTAEITVKLGSVEASEKITLTVKPAAPQPTIAAPTPTVSADSVISLFSNAYTDVTVDTWNTGWEFSTAVLEEIQIQGDDVKKYTELNFVGIEFATQTVDATNMTHFHMDIWTPDPTAAPAEFKVLLTDFGPDGVFGGGDDSSHEIVITSPTLKSGTWVGLDIPMSQFAGLASRAHLAQMVLSGDPNTVYVDNVYFYTSGGGGGASEPTVAAPDPPVRDDADVLSIFSGVYTDISGTDFNPGWGQSTVVTTEDIEGNSTLKYANFNFQGTAFASSQNASAMEYLHVDMWTSDATVVMVTPISGSGSPTEQLVSMTPIVAGQWNSYDIPVSDFTGSGMSFDDLIQMKFDGQSGVSPSTIYLDNIYFYKDPGGGGGESWTTDDVIDFESGGYGSGWSWNVFENDSNPALEFVSNPDATGANTSATVAKFTALQAGQPYAGCETAHGDIGSFTFSSENATVRMMVYKTVASDVGIKFAEANGEAQPEVKVANTKINEWEELTFDLSGSIGAGATGIIDQIIVFPDFNARAQDNVIYFDNIRFSNN